MHEHVVAGARQQTLEQAVDLRAPGFLPGKAREPHEVLRRDARSGWAWRHRW